MTAATVAALVSTMIVFVLRTRKQSRPDLAAWVTGEGFPIFIAFWFFYVLMILKQISL